MAMTTGSSVRVVLFLGKLNCDDGRLEGLSVEEFDRSGSRVCVLKSYGGIAFGFTRHFIDVDP